MKIVETYEADEAFIALLNLDYAAVVIDLCINSSFAVRAECTIETDTFHAVVQKQVVCFGGVEFGNAVDLREVLRARRREVVVEQLGELSYMRQADLGSYNSG